MRPSPNGQIPEIARKQVDLPDPEGPTSSTLSPAARERLLASTMRRPSGKLIFDILERDRRRAGGPGNAHGTSGVEGPCPLDRLIERGQTVDDRFKIRRARCNI